MSDVYFPFSSGVTTAVYILSKELPKYKVDVTLVIPSPKPIIKKNEQYSHERKIKILPSASLRGLYKNLRFPIRFYDAKEEIVDGETIFHVHSPMVSGTAVVKKLRNYRKKRVVKFGIIGSYHTRMDSYLSKRMPKKVSDKLSRLLNFYTKHVFRRMDLTTAPSNFAKNLAEAMGINNVIVMPNPLLRVFFKKPRVKLDEICETIEPYKYHFWLGRISHEKKVDVLAKLFCKSKTGIKFVFAGTGPILRKLREKFGNKKCIFLGYVPFDAAITLYRNAISFVSASDFETQGITFLEAMAQKTPVIAYHVGGHIDFIKHNVNGFLFREYTELRQYVQKLEKNQALRDELGENAYKTALKFHPDNLIPKYIKMYKKLLEII